MADAQSFGDRWQAYRPTKTLYFWSCVACVVLTMIVGFSWGGWVTGGTATEMAANAAEEGRAELAATVCVERFLKAPDAATQLASLKDASRWKRDDLVEKGGWTTLAGMDKPVADAAGLCAERLAEMDVPPAAAATKEATAVGEDAKVVQ